MSAPDFVTADRQYATVARAIGFIRANALQQPTLAEIATAVDLSEFHLQRLFSAWAGISPKRYLQFLTKEHAKQALRRSADTLSAALDSGLSGAGRLHDLMISCEAMTPGEIKRQGAGLTIRHGVMPTPFGRALVGWTDRGICHLSFITAGDPPAPGILVSEWPAAKLAKDPAGAAAIARRVFAKRPAPGTLHLMLRGTNFQLKVWEALLRVPPGRLVSYAQLANSIGAPRAARAVGSAVGANAIGFLIPCHRVICSSGELGDYRWGRDRKLAMLGREAGLARQD